MNAYYQYIAQNKHILQSFSMLQIKAETHAIWLLCIYIVDLFNRMKKYYLHIFVQQAFIKYVLCIFSCYCCWSYKTQKDPALTASILVGNQINRQEKYCILDISMLSYVTGNYRVATVDWVFRGECNI